MKQPKDSSNKSSNERAKKVGEGDNENKSVVVNIFVAGGKNKIDDKANNSLQRNKGSIGWRRVVVMLLIAFIGAFFPSYFSFISNKQADALEKRLIQVEDAVDVLKTNYSVLEPGKNGSDDAINDILRRVELLEKHQAELKALKIKIDSENIFTGKISSASKASELISDFDKKHPEATPSEILSEGAVNNINFLIERHKNAIGLLRKSKLCILNFINDDFERGRIEIQLDSWESTQNDKLQMLKATLEDYKLAPSSFPNITQTTQELITDQKESESEINNLLEQYKCNH